MTKLSFKKITDEDFEKLNNICDHSEQPELAEKFRKELNEHKRVIFALELEGQYIAEGALVFDMHDEDYTEPLRRIYLSHLIVKEDMRKQGYGGMMLEYLANQANYMGYDYLTVGVDLDNFEGIKLYTKHGFNTIIKADEDDMGKYLKLLRDVRLKIKCCNFLR